jgi:hypothetical protein
MSKRHLNSRSRDVIDTLSIGVVLDNYRLPSRPLLHLLMHLQAMAQFQITFNEDLKRLKTQAVPPKKSKKSAVQTHRQPGLSFPRAAAFDATGQPHADDVGQSRA